MSSNIDPNTNRNNSNQDNSSNSNNDDSSTATTKPSELTEPKKSSNPNMKRKNRNDLNRFQRCCNRGRDVFCNCLVETVVCFLTILITRRKRLSLFLTLFTLICIAWSMPYFTPNKIAPVRNTSHTDGSRGYLVDTDFCKIPDLSPYSLDIIKYFYRQKYKPCTSNIPLTAIEYNETTKEYLLILRSSLSVKCCYKTIKRPINGTYVAFSVVLGECVYFDKSIALPSTVEYIYVTCKRYTMEIYKNVHTMMPERPDIRKELDAFKENTTDIKPISILLFGIDSISRLHLIRSMPQTAQYLYDNEWFEMAGYNKIDDNTFPNIMAILTGWNLTTIKKKCNPTIFGELDKCPFIWKTFKKLGYVTALGEESESSMFHYLKHGFQYQPTDYYLRTALLQAATLPIIIKSKWQFCIGYKHATDYLTEYAFDFVQRYKNDSFFALFWTASYSHEDISDASFMDDKVLKNFKQLEESGTFNRTIVIFFSDHGLRFGPTRKYEHSHLEERLPFMFISIPSWIKLKYPKLMNALSLNKNRLTNPYDIHMTLKHILELSGRTINKLPKADDCPNCQSLFKPISTNRTCSDISIDEHWCTCTPFKSISYNTRIAQKLSNYAIEKMNRYTMKFRNRDGGYLCVFRTLKRIIGVYQSVEEELNLYRVVFYANPSLGQFESTINYNSSTNKYKIIGMISRLDPYLSQSQCIDDVTGRLYCYCK